MTFKLSPEEEVNAKIFTWQHVRKGCLKKTLLGHKRIKPEKLPTYSYIFTRQQGHICKFIQCNLCHEKIEITEKNRKDISM